MKTFILFILSLSSTLCGLAQDSGYSFKFKKAIELSDLLTDNGRSAIVTNTLKYSDIEGRSVMRVDSVARRRYDVIEFSIHHLDSIPLVLVLSGDGNQAIALEASSAELARKIISYLTQAIIMEEKTAKKLSKKLK